MTDRDAIFGRIRAALDPLPQRTAYPEWDDGLVVCDRFAPDCTDPVDRFRTRWEAAHGVFVASLDALPAVLANHGATHGFVDPLWLEPIAQLLPGNRLESTFERQRVDDYAFGITRATAGIAETGSIVLTDRDSACRLAALAPWIHVALLHRADIFATVGDALAGVPYDPSMVIITGPSKTADVEGILIEGVHGPGIQICCLVD
jgi:L-lactate dehydrogenase complex protein LldG